MYFKNNLKKWTHLKLTELREFLILHIQLLTLWLVITQP